jgi:hypothetical protein
MGATQTQLSDKHLLSRAYRDAFEQFKYEARRLAEIDARARYDAAAAESALLRVEQARLTYRESRDMLASMLLSPDQRRVFWAVPEASRVKGLAELFWVMAGKPQGSAEDDWYRAERVVRRASSPVACYAR